MVGTHEPTFIYIQVTWAMSESKSTEIYCQRNEYILKGAFIV